MKRALSIGLIILFIMLVSTSVAESGFSIHGISEATDAELESAIDAIKQEQISRLHISVSIAPEKLSLKKGESKQLKATLENLPSDLKSGKPSWTSSNEKFAKVNATGVVQGVGNGDAVISCTYTLLSV